MTKTKFLNNRGYSLLKSAYSETELNKIKDELTVKSNQQPMMDNIPMPEFPCFQESNKKLYIPKYYGLQKYGKADVTKFEDIEDINLEFKGSLRENQVGSAKAVIDACENEKQMGGLLSLLCGGGKTIISLYIISKLAKKTMIIVHKNFLLEQWKEKINEFLPNTRIGLIKAQVVNTENTDIVLCSLQSLSMKEYDPAIFKGIGLVIVDEIHRSSSQVFSRAYFKYVPKYSIGLSATMTRKDGLSKVFRWHIGDVVFKNTKRKDTVQIDVKEFNDTNIEYCKEVSLFNGRPMVPVMTTNIASYEPRTNFIVDTIKEILEKEPERQIIVLSDRKILLKSLHEKINSQKIGIAGFYIGKMKQAEMKYNEENCSILLATFQIASEGLDLKKLDTLILATSKSDIEQSVGRILRKPVDERTYIPLVVDIVDNFSVFPNQYKKRYKYYKKNKFDILYNGEDVTETAKKNKEKDFVPKGFAFISEN